MDERDVFSKIKKVQNRLNKDDAEYLKSYLSNAPYWVLESSQVVVKEPKSVFIEENAPADKVYILLEGIVRAVDYRVKGIAYDYMWLNSIRAFGAMEILFKLDEYKTTLSTVTTCTFLVMSRSNYERWLWEDKNVLQMEVESTGGNILEQNRIGRVLMFLQGMDRIIYMFLKNYEQSKPEGEYVLGLTRMEIAERCGFSVKTVNRAIKKMEEDGYIQKEGHKIKISKEQYMKMKNYLDLIVEQW